MKPKNPEEIERRDRRAEFLNELDIWRAQFTDQRQAMRVWYWSLEDYDNERTLQNTLSWREWKRYPQDYYEK